jgi:hypothetical protein
MVVSGEETLQANRHGENAVHRTDTFLEPLPLFNRGSALLHEKLVEQACLAQVKI